MARLWRKNPEFRGCKYIVKRRDGTVPNWEWFVLGERDEAAIAALRAYADKADDLGMDPEYTYDIRAMAREWEVKLQSGENTKGDPDAPRHRTDDPKIIEEMMNVPWIKAQNEIQGG